MIVQKFGGTSVGSPARMKSVAGLVTRGDYRGNLVVLSAMSGTTNSLVEISNYIREGNTEGAGDVINRLQEKYIGHIAELYESEQVRAKMNAFITEVFDYIRSFTKDVFTPREEKIILSQGEILSTNMMTAYLKEQGVSVRLLDALSFMRIDMNGEPDSWYIKQRFQEVLSAGETADLYITQGFICRDAMGEVDNLQRGGSDYTASLLGAACAASEIQIWTDIDGMHNNDPRFVEGTRSVPHLYFEEASELAYFGAKILHPTCIQPAKFCNIPVRLLNTMDPDAPGTVIDNVKDHGTIKAVAAKDNITAIKIKSGRMLLAYGFLRKVFEIFESHQTSIDMICTSEVGVSMSIDNAQYLPQIEADLRKYGTVTIDRNMCIICVVGDMDWENKGFESQVLDALKDVPVRMVSYGGSNYNISFLIRMQDKEQALKALSKTLF